MAKAKVWYGDVPNRRCSDCGEKVDWDERLRLGYFAQGGLTHPSGVIPLYDPSRAYGNTPEGKAEQAKLEAHYHQYHEGGLIESFSLNGWRLEIRRYSTALAFERDFLKRGRPYYGILETGAPNGAIVSSIVEGCRTPKEVKVKSGLGKGVNELLS